MAYIGFHVVRFCMVQPHLIIMSALRPPLRIKTTFYQWQNYFHGSINSMVSLIRPSHKEDSLITTIHWVVLIPKFHFMRQDCVYASSYLCFNRGSYSKPTVFDVLWIQLLLSPYYLVKYIGWWMRWLWKFTICRQEYGEEEKVYIIRRNMGLSQGRFDVSLSSLHHQITMRTKPFPLHCMCWARPCSSSPCSKKETITSMPVHFLLFILHIARKQKVTGCLGSSIDQDVIQPNFFFLCRLLKLSIMTTDM